MDDLVSDFIAETREGLEALDGELVHFERNPGDPALLGGIFRLIHTIKGTCGFLGLTRLQTIAHSAENVLGAFRDGELAVTPDAVSAILETVDLIRTLIDALAVGGTEPQGDDAALIARLDGVLAGEASIVPGTVDGDAVADGRPLIDQLGGDASLDAACEMILDELQDQAFGAIFADADRDRLQAALREGATAAARGSGGRADFQRRIIEIAPDAARPEVTPRILDLIGDALMKLGAPRSAVDELAMRIEPPGAAPPVITSDPPTSVAPLVQQAADRQDGDAASSAQTIRVSVDALEHLMTVVSELVLIRNQLIQTLRLDPESPFAAPLNRLNQVTSELQEGVMTTRMQPISGAWAKLPRLVRDLAKDLGKQIDLSMVGQDTELDRQVLELIKDPLTHMIRNAVDHGLEPPAERVAAGKAPVGRIMLTARHEGGAIVIEVGDDGRGLPAAKIREKAIARGLAPASEIEAMSDADVRRFIFAAGFSTADAVTAVSGRGVGMDVVRTNIEKIGGAIEVSSVEGQGARFTIRIPLTLTIVSALIVECCGERFAMPQSSVVELVSASDGSGRNIEYIDGAAVLRLRDRLLPLVSLQALLGLDAGPTTASEPCIVVARVGSFTFGIVVDRVFDTEEIVVKPVATVLRHLKLYSGATILGDGAVILILDFKGISLETGAGQVASGALQDDDLPAATAAEKKPAILVFRSADGALKATPLGSVARIEEIAEAQLETVDGRMVIQYRGHLMPVIGAVADQPLLWGDDVRRPLLVFARDDRSVGLLVSEIVDIVESSMALDLGPSSGGALGSLIVDGVATELIDVAYLWRIATGERGEGSALPAKASKRLLVIDQSPFSELMLQPMLRQAGYDVSVAPDAAAALALHANGETFNLILADSSHRGPSTKQLATALQSATNWHRTPFLGLGREDLSPASHGRDVATMLQAVADTFDEDLRGAA
ncbi:hybrid sensor histidine kinase/response regulator [uncultured Phenylobacterium sp.]|uniref:hybrid sensor histidine kinase/response regulator n=1 Tax=uncultured Phenylobacterium sp. TaxID=349273 RepID=UPI0025E29A02|nr:hybrid sensor histidine kinase/response regulator [uncultured Phenylobacterium sp.]